MNELFKWIIKFRFSQVEEVRNRPFELQSKWFDFLVSNSLDTQIGQQFQFHSNLTYETFAKNTPLHTYEMLQPYINAAIEGKENVLWRGVTNWFSKSSGTTSDRSKFIPVTEESLFENHYRGGKDLLANYYEIFSDAQLFSGKTLVIGGSSQVNELNENSYIGDLSAIILKNLPWWVEMKRTPSKEVALMSDWEAKIEKMAHETMKEDVRILSGVPSWTLVLCHRILELKKTTNLLEVWPSLELFMHGGVNFEPYRKEFERIIPSDKMHYIETYNASEGMFGFQDRRQASDMLLLLDHGIFYEFIPMSEFKGVDSKKVIRLEEVKTNENYALVISTIGGLWRYIVGDTIKFTSVHPFRFRVTGRTKSFINAFGEELIVENAEKAIAKTSEELGVLVMNYTAGPIYMSFGETENKGQHEWIVELMEDYLDKKLFVERLDYHLRSVNSDYDAKRTNDIAFLAPKVHFSPKGTFDNWLKSKNKMGGQHKIPRLSNDRTIVEEVLQLMKEKNEN